MGDDQDEERPARRRAVQSCGNRDHARLLQWHDLWERSVHDRDDRRQEQAERIKTLEHEVLAAESELRYVRMQQADSGIAAVRERYEMLLEQARAREVGWREEFEHARRRSGEETDRAIRAEELIEQGLLREHQMVRHLEALTAIPLLFARDAGMIVCSVCNGHTTKQGATPADIEHVRDCSLKQAQDSIRRWNEDGGMARQNVAGELALLRSAVVAVGIDRLEGCPSCGADRTNGEWHRDDCPLLPLLAQQERRRDR